MYILFAIELWTQMYIDLYYIVTQGIQINFEDLLIEMFRLKHHSEKLLKSSEANQIFFLM